MGIRGVLISITGGIILAIEAPRAYHVGRNYYMGRQFRQKARLEKYQTPHLVVLGSGWGAISVLKRLVPGAFRVTVISPHNYFLFTPLLPSAAVGTVEPRSIIQPIRNILQKLCGDYICAEAIDVAPDEGYLTCRSSGGNLFTVDYDYLVIAVGSQVNTFNTPGVEEYALKLKSIADSRKVRGRFIDNFERAHLLPEDRKEERAQLLQTVIVGGGPTGVELAAELYDLLQEDLVKLYPKELTRQAKVILVQSADHILNTYDLEISKYAERVFLHDGIQVITNARVLEVRPDHIVYQSKHGERALQTMPSGLTVWSTGVSMVPLAKQLVDRIEGQNHGRSLLVDGWLRLKGVMARNIFAIGDCASIHVEGLTRSLGRELFTPEDNSLNLKELQMTLQRLEKSQPELKIHILFLNKLLCKYGPQEGDTISVDVLRRLLQEIDVNLRSLPATAQVATQQGRYLGDLLNRIAWSHLRIQPKTLYDLSPPFFYRHIASAAYLGTGHAVFDFGKAWYGDRFLSFWLWKSIYLSEQVSLRTRLMVAFDWFKTFCFGRDISNLK